MKEKLFEQRLIKTQKYFKLGENIKDGPFTLYSKDLHGIISFASFILYLLYLVSIVLFLFLYVHLDGTCY